MTPRKTCLQATLGTEQDLFHPLKGKKHLRLWTSPRVPQQHRTLARPLRTPTSRLYPPGRPRTWRRPSQRAARARPSVHPDLSRRAAHVQSSMGPTGESSSSRNSPQGRRVVESLHDSGPNIHSDTGSKTFLWGSTFLSIRGSIHLCIQYIYKSTTKRILYTLYIYIYTWWGVVDTLQSHWESWSTNCDQVQCNTLRHL